MNESNLNPSSKRAWIIGNGSSLLDTPLHLLKDELTWGMNSIYLHYKYTPWRPTYYYCMDVNEKDTHWREAIRANQNCQELFLWEGWRDEFQGNITWLPRCKKHHFYAADNYLKRAESWHLPTLCTAFGSMYVVMQLAVLQGATEIYLVGCDLFKGQNDHCNKDYPAFADWKNRNMIETYLHSTAKRSSPVPIYNCTVGGMLEVYERKNIYEVLNG